MIFGFSFKSKGTKIGSIVLDVLTNEKISLPGDVTRYPIESGSEISDHIINKAITLRISGKISHSSGMLFDFSNTFGSTRLFDAVAELVDMRTAKKLVDVTTGLNNYTDMGIASIEITRSNDELGGNWISIDMELVQVVTVELETAEVPADAPTQNRAGRTATPSGRSTPQSAGRATAGAPTNPNGTSLAASAADGGARSFSPTSVLGAGAAAIGGRAP